MNLVAEWFFMLIAPLDFTFTDPADFIFITLIPLTLMGIAWQHYRRPNSPRWIRFAERAGYTLAIIGPLVPLAVLYLASWRSFEVLGHWPDASQNPKSLLGQDALYKYLFRYGVTQAMAFGGWSIISLGALLLHLRRQVPVNRLVGIVVAFIVAYGILAMEPTDRISWWLW